MQSGDLIREARLRAGLSQHELAERSGRDRSVIARWEQGVVAPSIETLVEVVRACGFDLPLELVPHDDSTDEQLRKNALLSPERRIQRLLRAASAERGTFDPYAILAALDRHRVAYIVIGGFARLIQGAEEITDGVDVVPSLRGENLTRLEPVLEELAASRTRGEPGALDEQAIRSESILRLRTSAGKLAIVPEPAGTRGAYDDLRRAATREPIGKGLRPAVASTRDLARMLAALDREQDRPTLRQLRQLAELERGLGRGFKL